MNCDTAWSKCGSWDHISFVCTNSSISKPETEPVWEAGRKPFSGSFTCLFLTKLSYSKFSARKNDLIYIYIYIYIYCCFVRYRVLHIIINVSPTYDLALSLITCHPSLALVFIFQIQTSSLLSSWFITLHRLTLSPLTLSFPSGLNA